MKGKIVFVVLSLALLLLFDRVYATGVVGSGADPLAGVFPPTVQDPVVPLISLPSTFQSRRVNCDNLAPEGSNSVVIADLKGPGCIKHIWILDACGPRLEGKFSLEILVDGAKTPQVSAPVKAFFGVMNDQEYTVINSSFAVLPNFFIRKFFNSNKEEGNPGYNMFLPIPFSKSCRITLINPPNRHGVGMVDWHKYQKGAPLTPLRLYADYRYYNPSRPSGNHVELANIEGAGFIHGVQLGYDQLNFKDCLFHTGGMTILIDGETNPHAIRGHNAEDDFGIAWGFNTVQTPWLGCPWYKMRPKGRPKHCSKTRLAPITASSPPIRLFIVPLFRSAPVHAAI